MKHERQIAAQTHPQTGRVDRETTLFAFALWEGFCLMDLATAISTLAAANRVAGRRLYDWVISSHDGNAVRCSNGVPYPVETRCELVSDHARTFVLAFDTPFTSADRSMLAWLRRASRGGTIMGAFGTGAFLLIQAGLLVNRRFALHWSARPAFSELYPEHPPEASLYAVDGRFFTSAGGHAAADMMIAILARDIDPAFGVRVADYLVSPSPRKADTPQRQAAAGRFGTRNPVLLAIIDAMECDDDCELDINALLEEHRISRRQLQRLFARYCGTTPARFLKDIRLDRARSLLDQTNMSVLDVAMATGFPSASNFSKSFARKFGCAPSRYCG